jgi:DNA phosphorothioation-associated putative methyltransferase
MLKSPQQPFGKHVADHVYAHVSAIELMPTTAAAVIEQACKLAQVRVGHDFNVVKIHETGEQLSLLLYGDFWNDPFPALAKSWRVNVSLGTVVYRNYEESLNPPILHRKELLLSPEDQNIAEFVQLTRTAESLGLFDDPSRIGFREPWLALIEARGYQLQGADFVPIGNMVPNDDATTPFDGHVRRHLTALSRSNLSAPVQALWRYGLLAADRTFFDYGCGKGDDVRTLSSNGIDATGWDPYFCPGADKRTADTVNLGFVINVIEDLDERIEALQRAYDHADGVLAVAAMLASQQPPEGRTHGDGYLTSRNTFQKYFSQIQLRDFIEHVLDESAIAVAPGVFFVFKDKNLEQRFLQRRYGSRSTPAFQGTWLRTMRAEQRQPRPRERVLKLSRAEALFQGNQAHLRALWLAQVKLGRPPLADELEPVLAEQILAAIGSLSKALKIAERHFDSDELSRAEKQKQSDLVVLAALQQFGRRPPYRELDEGLRRDIRYHFGDYRNLQSVALEMLRDLNNLQKLNAACVSAAEHGLGWLQDSQSLQLHTSLVPRLPGLLRIYIGCATILVGDTSEYELIKIHIRSGKLTLLKYDEFDATPLPRLVQRVKVKLKELDLDLFEYGSPDYSSPLLFFKSRYMNEECVKYMEQLAFDEHLESLQLLDFSLGEPSAKAFGDVLTSQRWEVDGFELARSKILPDLDARCGQHLTYRQLIECSETQRDKEVLNLPRQADSYTALHELAFHILDPVIDYFGMIKLTYGFCSPDLTRHIRARIAPRLDQHAAHELNRYGKPICERLGAACDFIVTDEDMEDVALWVAANTPFDRLYFYGKDRPIHVSYSETPARQFVRMTTNSAGARIPRIDRTVPIFDTGKS